VERKQAQSSSHRRHHGLRIASPTPPHPFSLRPDLPPLLAGLPAPKLRRPRIKLPAPDTPPLLLRRRWRDPSRGGSSVCNRQPPPLICIQGERACIFSSPVSSDANCVPSMPPLLEKESTMHRDGGEGKMHLHIVVGLSLRWCKTTMTSKQQRVVAYGPSAVRGSA
jgi:hypothetical protein